MIDDFSVLLSLGIGLMVNIAFNEIFGLAAGGIVVPGYVALNLHSPKRLLITFIIGFIVFIILKGFSKIVVLYGKRLLLMAILLGVLIGQVANYFFEPFILKNVPTVAIGYVIPGLIAYWMEKQGILKTMSATIIGAVLTYLFFICVTGGRIPV